MSNIQLDTDPQFNESMETIEVTTPVHADVMNERFKQLLENEKYLKDSKADRADIPSIPDSLPANGGNADTVGGKLPSAFAPAGHTHSKADVGLGNVDNTADINKSVNYANSAGNADTVDGWHMNLAVGAWGIKPICSGTGDMVAGSTGLSQGHVYIVYE